ncbi:unnamed protein product [Rotaria sp. Silwood2]|nr:unnamed protein product [Rotaria sp. Silwood2]CAF3971708.1 unnamed protein product [Rotaria sp. Silwood2]
MAGMKLERIAATLNQNNIIRAMPNSPAELGMGMTAFTANNQTTFALSHPGSSLSFLSALPLTAGLCVLAAFLSS